MRKKTLERKSETPNEAVSSGHILRDLKGPLGLQRRELGFLPLTHWPASWGQEEGVGCELPGRSGPWQVRNTSSLGTGFRRV